MGRSAEKKYYYWQLFDRLTSTSEDAYWQPEFEVTARRWLSLLRLWSLSVAAHVWLTTRTTVIHAANHASCTEWSWSASPVCPHRNNWDFGRLLFRCCWWRCLFLSQVWFQRRLRHKHTLSKTICNQAVSVLVPPFFLCSSPSLFKQRIFWPGFIFVYKNPSGRLSVSEPAQRIPHSQSNSGGEQGVLPQNERRLLQIPVRGGLWGLKEGWVSGFKPLKTI